STTVASLQSSDRIQRRRRVMLGLTITTYLALAGWMASVVGASGWTSVDVPLCGCFLVMAPWTVLGFWNALIGLWLLHGRRDGLEQAAPTTPEDDEPLRLKTALVMTLRNEDSRRALLRLKTMKRSID